MICAYLFFEFVRPQALFPVISVIPWAQLCLMGALIGALADPTANHVKSIANVYIVLFSIVILVSVATAYRTDLSKMYFMDFFSWVIVYFLIIRIVNTKERFYIFLLIFLFAAGKIAFGTSKSWASRGFSFDGWGLSGPRGFFENSGELSILMVMLFPIAFYLYQLLKNRAVLWERCILIVLWVCPILTVLGASSRGSQLALAVIMIIMFRKSIFRFKSLLAVVILAASLFYLLPEEQKERFRNTGSDKTSQQRLLYWENGWDMMKKHPFTGVGFFNFVPYFEAYYPEDMLYSSAQLPHNIFVQVGTDAGFPALIFFLLLIGYSVKTTYSLSRGAELNLPKAISAGLGIGVVGYVIAGQFVTVTYYPFFWVHLALIVALTNCFDVEKSEN
jgi:putative inorganic carbon (HCO3(-)) transporter